MKKNTRDVSATVIVKVFKGKSLTVALDEAWDGEIDAKDKAFIQALCYGTIRYYNRLECILNQLVHKPIKELNVKALALLGLYQLQYMRVKDHAAVSETVAVMKKKPWAKSLLNAVLRRYLREQERLNAFADKHAAYNHPDWMIKRIKADWPEEAKHIFTENNQAAPMVLRVNRKFCSRDDYFILLQKNNMSAELSNYAVDAIILTEAVMVDQLPHFNEGWVSVQDSAAQMAAPLLNAQPAERILDLCAAPGGKTAHILALQEDLHELLAVDIDTGRLESVVENLQRLQGEATLLAADAAEPDTWWDGQLFDRILLDAPCSALGVIRRHPDIKLLRFEQDIDALQVLQQRILESAWQMLKPGGILLYATCSILKQENEEQIASFLKAHSDASEAIITANWGVKRPHGRQVLTGFDTMDGFYYARLCKK